MTSKVASDRNQRQLLELLKVEGNSVCADCGSRNPRWAAWDHGIFICVQCAGIHRKMGTHVSKVKSLTLDTWSKEQVERMKVVGNSRSNAVLNPDELRNRPPTSLDESERGSQLEKYIRKKYETKSFLARIISPPIPSTSATPAARSTTNPIPSSSAMGSTNSSPDSIKQVRFRAASVPIPDVPLGLGSRVPSRLGIVAENGGEMGTRGILRPRSATSAVDVGGAAAAMEMRGRRKVSPASTTREVPFAVPPPQASAQAQAKVEEPRFNPSIWDDMSALAGNTPYAAPPPPQQQQLQPQQTGYYPVPTPPVTSNPYLPSYAPPQQYLSQPTPPPLQQQPSYTSQPQIQQFVPSSQFGQQLSYQQQQQQQPHYQSSTMYPTPGVGTPGVGLGSVGGNNPFALSMGGMGSSLPQPSTNPFYSPAPVAGGYYQQPQQQQQQQPFDFPQQQQGYQNGYPVQMGYNGGQVTPGGTNPFAQGYVGNMGQQQGYGGGGGGGGGMWGQ